MPPSSDSWLKITQESSELLIQIVPGFIKSCVNIYPPCSRNILSNSGCLDRKRCTRLDGAQVLSLSLSPKWANQNVRSLKLTKKSAPLAKDKGDTECRLRQDWLSSWKSKNASSRENKKCGVPGAPQANCSLQLATKWIYGDNTLYVLSMWHFDHIVELKKYAYKMEIEQNFCHL